MLYYFFLSRRRVLALWLADRTNGLLGVHLVFRNGYLLASDLDRS